MADVKVSSTEYKTIRVKALVKTTLHESPDQLSHLLDEGIGRLTLTLANILQKERTEENDTTPRKFCLIRVFLVGAELSNTANELLIF